MIVVEFYTGGSADSFDVADVGVSGDVLTIHFTDPESGNAGATAAWVHYAVIIVDKNDFSGEASDVRFTFFDDFPINGEKRLLYKVTIVENGYDKFFDKPMGEYFEAGTVITIHCYPIMDADLVMYINGKRIGIQHSVEGEDGYYIWEYSFTVPEEDIVVTFKTEGGM